MRNLTQEAIDLAKLTLTTAYPQLATKQAREWLDEGTKQEIALQLLIHQQANEASLIAELQAPLAPKSDYVILDVEL